MTRGAGGAIGLLVRLLLALLLTRFVTLEPPGLDAGSALASLAAATTFCGAAGIHAGRGAAPARELPGPHRHVHCAACLGGACHVPFVLVQKHEPVAPTEVLVAGLESPGRPAQRADPFGRVFEATGPPRAA